MNGEKQNNFEVNKKVIALIIIAICIIVAIVITIIIVNNNEQRNLETSNNKQMQEIENSDNSDNFYNMNVSSEETYNSSSNINQEIVMPNLVGINYADLSNYLANNDLYFISDIKFITDNQDNSGAIPYKVLATIPEAGTLLNPNTDTSITIYTTSVYSISKIKLEYINEKDWEIKHFGKTLKIQIGEDENNFIEGVIGSDFYETASEFVCNCSGSTVKEFWNMYQENQVIYISRNEIDSGYVDGKIWIDNQLVEETTFAFSGGTLKTEI